MGDKLRNTGNTSPKQPPQTALLFLLKLQVAKKTIRLFCSDLREPICCLNTQSGSRCLLKRLSESREEVAVLEHRG